MLDPNEIFEKIRIDMIQSLENTNLENISDQKELSLGYFALFESLKYLMELKTKRNQTETDVTHDSSSLIKQEYSITKPNKTLNVEGESEKAEYIEQGGLNYLSTVIPTIKQNETTECYENTSTNETESAIERKMYFFERKALGGFINELKAIVPENIVAKLNIEHGDYLYADEIMQADVYSKKKYHYELAKKGTISKDVTRIQLNFCPIEKDGTLLVVSKSYESGTIRINEVPQSLVLGEQDIQYFKLEEGQLVDVAYIKGKEHTTRVVYRHDIEVIQDGARKSVKKKSIREKDTDRDQTVIEQTLEGKTILVVGNEPDKSLYKQNVEERGGDFLWADGKDSVDSFEPLVRKSDVVVFLLSVSGHTAMKHIKRLCKEYNIPFQHTFNISSTTIIRLAESCENTQVSEAQSP